MSDHLAGHLLFVEVCIPFGKVPESFRFPAADGLKKVKGALVADVVYKIEIDAGQVILKEHPARLAKDKALRSAVSRTGCSRAVRYISRTCGTGGFTAGGEL